MTIADNLTGAVGGTHDHWIEQVGRGRKLPITMNIYSNWRVSPIATGDDLAAIVKAIELVRAEHPYVTG